ncbi:MAG TPA: 4-alpha-glucanotransferase [Anaeromyxobacteraceae bacterium]|jgi:4-alpha-glucanotransferase
MRPVRQRVREALLALGIRRLLLAVHDAAFPSGPDEDLGHGAPASAGGGAFLAWVRDLGFDGVQLGPPGATSEANPSPYDATWFSRNPAALVPAALAGPEVGALVPAERVAACVAARPAGSDRVSLGHALAAARGLLGEAATAFRARRARGERGAIAALDRELSAFRARSGWLARDAIFEVLRSARAAPDPLPPWPVAPEAQAALAARHEAEVESYALAQLLLHRQHRRLRALAKGLRLFLFGDLQVGMSERDEWAFEPLLLRGYRLGAPPSRTNPAGQAWHYPVLDPAAYRATGAAGRAEDGPAIALLRARLAKLLEEHDGLRIDHPHGLVCPWVYRAGPDPDRAVRDGARLFSSPDLPDHPDLARYAIARPEQLDRSRPRHADDWVRELDEAQVERYASLLDVVMEEARAAGRGLDRIACEVLSTQPLPLRRVIERQGLGRFRVTQKADLERADDVYRGENARPEDWVLLGNHDTPTIWQVAEQWVASGAGAGQARYAGERLRLPEAERAGWERRVAGDPAALAQARFADLFVGPASHVLVSFGDLLGFREPYNVPGTVSARNWTQRIPRDYRTAYRTLLGAGRALDLPRALAAALRARGVSPALAGSLEQDAGGRGAP